MVEQGSFIDDRVAARVIGQAHPPKLCLGSFHLGESKPTFDDHKAAFLVSLELAISDRGKPIEIIGGGRITMIEHRVVRLGLGLKNDANLGKLRCGSGHDGKGLLVWGCGWRGEGIGALAFSGEPQCGTWISDGNLKPGVQSLDMTRGPFFEIHARWPPGVSTSQTPTATLR